MADIDWDDVTDLAAELTVVSANAQTLILAWVNDEALDAAQFNGGADGSTYKLARIYLAAHFGQLSSSLGDSDGSVMTEKMGDLSRTFQLTTTTNPHELATTRWGRMYLALIRRSLAGCPRVL